MEVNQIATKLNITLDKATQIKGIIKGTVDPMSFTSVQRWVDQCFNMPSKLELKLEAINEILEGFGIEYIEPRIEESYTDPQGLSYINLGDSYINTVMFNHATGKFMYSSWGDIVENSNEYL